MRQVLFTVVQHLRQEHEVIADPFDQAMPISAATSW
jgi:hypothetical protein